MNFKNHKSICCCLLWLLPTIIYSQDIHHWEAAVLAEEMWYYRVGNSEPPTEWKTPGFDASAWNIGTGGFGYADGDDNTIVPPTISLYLRRDFEIWDTSAIDAISLYADYDDAFVAYLNGVEIARANIGTVGVVPLFDQTSITDHEAQLYRGGATGGIPASHATSEEPLEKREQHPGRPGTQCWHRFFRSFCYILFDVWDQ